MHGAPMQSRHLSRHKRKMPALDRYAIRGAAGIVHNAILICTHDKIDILT